MHTSPKHPPAPEVDKEADSSDPACTVNPLDTIEGGTVKPVGISLVHCPVCGVYFSNEELYKGHINKYHQHLMLTCKFCNKVIFSPEVSHHIAVTHTTCFSCLESFTSEELLEAHIMECMAPASQVSSVTVPVQPDDPALIDIPEPAPAPEPHQPVTEPTPQASGSDQPRLQCPNHQVEQVGHMHVSTVKRGLPRLYRFICIRVSPIKIKLILAY